MRFIAAFLLFASIVAPGQAQQATRSEADLIRALDELLADSALVNATVGVAVMDAETGRTIYARNAEKTLMPASNTKLYTTAAALDQLGADFRWSTRLYADRGTQEGSILHANLLVRGAGDPVIGGRFNEGNITAAFRAWADSLKAAGIRTVDGHLIGDDDVFDDQQLGYGWSWDDEPWYYSAEISALSFNDNVVDFTVEPTEPGGPARITWEPLNTDYVKVRNSTVTLPQEGDLDEGYARGREDNHMVVSTLVPVGYTEKESISVFNPTRYFLHVLRQVLIEEGIAITGGIHDVDDLPSKPDYEQARLLATHTSQELARVVEVLNKESNNLYAEMLLKTLGHERPDTTSEAPAGSSAMGWDAAMRTLATAAVDTARITLVDGSGLSRINMVSPSMTGALLTYMWAHPDTTTRRVYYESLPIAGVDGTLEYRMTSGDAFRNVRAKTGTLTGASALSGYVTSAAGRPLVFSLMMNMYAGSSRAARTLQDRIAETLASHQR